MSLAFPVALAGLTIGSLIAISLYPPLVSNWLLIFVVPVISSAAAAVLAFVLSEQLTRYATLIRLVIVLVAATWLIPAGYYFLNGILDGNQAIVVPSLVLSKGVSHGKGGGPYLFLSLLWNREKIDVDIRVSLDTLSAAEPGDSVHLVVHPGAFSQPWYGDVLLSESRTSTSR